MLQGRQKIPFVVCALHLVLAASLTEHLHRIPHSVLHLQVVFLCAHELNPEERTILQELLGEACGPWGNTSQVQCCTHVASQHGHGRNVTSSDRSEREACVEEHTYNSACFARFLYRMVFCKGVTGEETMGGKMSPSSSRSQSVQQALSREKKRSCHAPLQDHKPNHSPFREKARGGNDRTKNVFRLQDEWRSVKFPESKETGRRS